MNGQEITVPDLNFALSQAKVPADADKNAVKAQYTPDEYRARVGWGHSSVDHLSAFLHGVKPVRPVMFHHDPSHSDDFLESMRTPVEEQTSAGVELGAELVSYEV